MANGSTIEWTQATWNPVTGCTKVSPGCKNCYAERMSKRLQAMGVEQYRNAFQLATHDESLKLPLRWKKPRKIFVNSMSDLFQKELSFDFIRRVFDVMVEASQHQFQILTKRPDIALAYANKLPWPDNVWLGTSVENACYTYRIHELRRVPAKVRFLSIEPLLGRIGRLPLTGIHWVIVGGESGPGARPMKEEWVTAIRDRCLKQNVPFFFKQWGGVNKKRTGRELEGKTWDQLPQQTTTCEVSCSV